MIDTFFGSGTLDSPAAFLFSLLLGIAFGASLEQAGFGSSRRLSGIFYFRDMAVLKVMFTAVVTAMLGLCYARALGWVTAENVYFLPTAYGAQITGGLMFGAGFVMSGWCPGTGAVGLASGKVDALVFLLGVAGGSILYNETYPLLAPLFSGDRGVLFAYDGTGLSRAGFAFLFTLVAAGCFWGSEYLEKKRFGRGELWNTPFLKVFSAVLITGAFGLFAVAGEPEKGISAQPAAGTESELLQGLDAGLDHMEPAELADRLLAGDASIRLVDIRTPGEYARFHIRSAENIAVGDLPASLAPNRNLGLIVLYSNGMTHPAQARDSLFRSGFRNVYFLTDGLDGFLETCLRPVSLRTEPVSGETAAKIDAWRAFFLSEESPEKVSGKPGSVPAPTEPRP